MIDRQQFRKAFDAMQAQLARRGIEVVAPDSPWGTARALDGRQRELKTELEALQAERNRVSKLIGQQKGQGEDAAVEMAAMKDVSARIKQLEGEAKDAEGAFAEALLNIPNPPHDMVPDGADEADNVELRRWGTPRTDAVPPHWEIGTALGILDFEAGTTIAGSRFTVLREAPVRKPSLIARFDRAGLTL